MLVTSKPKELGTYTIQAKDKLLFEHDAANIPKLGADVGTLNNKTKELQTLGKIVDIIGPVKNPIIVVKLQRQVYDQSLFSKEMIFYWKKEFFDDKNKKVKKKSFRKPTQEKIPYKERKNVSTFKYKTKKNKYEKESNKRKN